jgi:hypothetical protein
VHASIAAAAVPNPKPAFKISRRVNLLLRLADMLLATRGAAGTLGVAVNSSVPSCGAQALPRLKAARTSEPRG